MLSVSRMRNMLKWPYKNLLVTGFIIACYVGLISPWGIIPLVLGYQDCCSNAGVLQHEFYFFPYISNWISTAIYSLLGIDGLILIGQALFPAAVFALLIAIYSRHLSLLWAVSLAFLAVSMIVDYPFRQYLLQIASGMWIDLGSDRLPEILYFPIPSFSTLYFLGIFYLTTRYTGVVMRTRDLSIFTILFSLTIYINAIDIVFALPFWFIYFPFKLFHKKFPLKMVSLEFLIQLLLAGIIITPALLLANYGIANNIPSPPGYYYISMYLLAPLILMGLLFFVQRIDPYDLLYRFRHIYILMLAEALMLLVALTGVIPLNLQISQNRLAQFFAHTYYYLPVVYYASQLTLPPAFGIESSQFSKSLRSGLHVFFVKYSPLYLAPLIALLCLYNLTSAIKYLEKISNS
jgi:hypothetical protein